MEVIKAGTNIATVKISELPQTTDTSGRSTLATNADNESEALELTQISEAIDAAAIAQQAATEAKEAAKNANTLAGVARTAASNAEAAAEDAQTARNSAETAATEAKDAADSINQDLTGKADLDANKKYLLATQLDPKTGYQTGVVMGKGSFSKDSANLKTLSSCTVVSIVETGDDVTTDQCVCQQSTRILQCVASGGIGEYYLTKAAAAPNTLYEVVSVFEEETNLIKSYVNGVFVNERDASFVSPAEKVFYIGQTTGQISPFLGKILSVRMFDFAMTDEQIANMWNGGYPMQWRVPDEWRIGLAETSCILDLVPESLTPTLWRDISGQGNDMPYTPFEGNPDACELSYEAYESEVAKAKKSIMYGSQTAVTISGSKGYFKSDSPALVTPDQPSTLIVCFKMPQSGTSVIYDCNTTSSSVTAKGEYIYAQNRMCRISIRNYTTTNTTLQENTQLCMAAISYTPNGTLIRRINERVIENEAPEYPNAYEPEHMRLGGWSSSYVEAQIISVRRFDFAMTKEQLDEAWNGGHPELWEVPDKYRYGEVGARCFLDLNPKGLLPTVWRDMSGHGNDGPYYPMLATSPTECELSYENHGFKDKIIGTAAPAIYPNFTGQEFIDTTNKVTYIAYGTSSAGDWK